MTTTPPTVGTFNPLTVPTLQKYEKYIPTAFNSELTMLQKVNNLIDYLSTVTDTVNGFGDQWNTIVDWVDGDGLTNAVDTQLGTWKDDGTLGNLINTDIETSIGSMPSLLTTAKDSLVNAVNELVSDIDSNFKHSLSGSRILSITEYPRLTGETDDTARLNRLLGDAVDGSIIFLGDGLSLSVASTLTLTKNKLTIFGYNTELLTVTQGMDNTFSATSIDGLVISGLRFNQNEMGRTSINLQSCTNFIIKECYFTGYSAQYAYYQTDGGIRCYDGANGKVLNNTWENHGYQYDTTTTTLNRCLQFGSTSNENMLVMGNIFNQVNQAIVVGAGNISIVGNTFKNVRDNVLYMVGADSVLFSGNYVDHRYDECLVIGSGKLVVVGNQIKNTTNKAISITDTSTTKPPYIVITGNDFDLMDVNTGQFIAWRNFSYTVQLMIVEGNRFNCPANNNPYPYFDIGNISRFKFYNNSVNVATQQYQKIIYFEPTTKATGEVVNNRFIGSSGSQASSVSCADSTLTTCRYENNSVQDARAGYGGLRVFGHSLQVVGSSVYVNDRSSLQVVTSNAMPTSGAFTQGDYVKNEVPTVQGSTGSQYVVKGWVRLTTGSNHVLNTDWAQDRALTGS